MNALRWALATLLLLSSCADKQKPAAPQSADIQQRTMFVQDPRKIDTPEEAVARAHTIVAAHEGDGAQTKHEFECMHWFGSPFELRNFAPAYGQVFIIRVGGYDTKDADGVINGFLWINERGEGIWEK